MRASWPGAALTLGLSAFGSRRAVFTLAAALPYRPRRATVSSAAAPTVCVIVPAHNEAAVLDRTLQALSQLRAPGSLSVIVVDDGSTDGTAAIARWWTNAGGERSLVRLERASGKGAALNAGIEASPPSDIVVACDADVSPDPDALLELLDILDREPGVLAASSLLWPENAGQSLVSRYCALELWQHQLVTSQAKDRLALNPPAHGWFSAYRRSALVRVGGFPERSLGEDVELSRKLEAAGGRTRFAGASRVYTAVPETLSGYWHQHVRWSRALHDARPREHRDARRVPLRIRAEQFLHAAGYLDRPLLAAAVILAQRRRLPLRVPASYAAITAAELLVALARAGALRRAPAFLCAAAVMLPVDLAASVTGSCLQLVRARRTWRPARRARPTPSTPTASGTASAA